MTQSSVSIRVRYESIDSYGRGKVRTFKTLAGASKFAVSMVGEHPEFGTTYAVSGDGIGKITVSGCTLAELFAAPGAATDGYRIEATWDGFEGGYRVLHGTRVLGYYDDEIEAQSHVASAREFDALPASEKDAITHEPEAADYAADAASPEAVAARAAWVASFPDDDEMPF